MTAFMTDDTIFMTGKREFLMQCLKATLLSVLIISVEEMILRGSLAIVA